LTPKFSIVCFDVDSTLVTIEGIDILGAGNPEIARITEATMNGEIPIHEAYRVRLETLKPSRERIEALGAQYTRSLVDGAEETITTLQNARVEVHLVTAGISQAIAPLARRLHIAPDRVHAVDVRFDQQGNYAGFDDKTPLTRNGGKATVVRDIRAKTPGAAAMVGDGVSDLETGPAVDLFIGYGGVAVRSKVKESAGVYVTARDLRSVLKHLMHE
jgi:phosphoserine phosphatase